MAAEPLIEKGFLEKLERLTLRWQRSFPGTVGGHNASSFPGPGQEFLDHRTFHQGDDLRAVNWRAYLRFEKLFMKMFHVEPRVPVRLLLDTSRSMNTGQRGKFLYARRLTAALVYVALVRLETLTLAPFGEGLGDPLLCSGGRHRFAPVADFLQDLKPGGSTRFLETVRQFSGRYLQRGLLILVSDFLDPDGCERPLQYLADFGHEMLLLQVWDEEDRSPPWYGELELVDAESGAAEELEFDDGARERYTRAFDEHARGLERVALRSGGRYVGLSTSTPVEEVIFGVARPAKG